MTIDLFIAHENPFNPLKSNMMTRIGMLSYLEFMYYYEKHHRTANYINPFRPLKYAFISNFSPISDLFSIYIKPWQQHRSTTCQKTVLLTLSHSRPLTMHVNLQLYRLCFAIQWNQTLCGTNSYLMIIVILFQSWFLL